MTKFWLPALRLFLALTLLTGVIYPLAVTAFAHVFFPHLAGGSLVERDGHVVGSALIAQKFTSDRYFHPRPSAVDFNPLPSGGSNLGPTSKTLKERVNGAAPGTPADLVFASGSGLDPHVSSEGALFQAVRVARARGLTEESVRELVRHHVEEPDLSVFGERRVNVLLLNLALDREDGGHP